MKKKLEGLLIAEKLAKILARHKVPTQDSESLLIGDEILNLFYEELDKAREEGRREVYEAIVFDENIPHDITTFVAANLWKNMRDKAKEELSKLKDNK